MQILHLPFALHWPPKHELKHIKSGIGGCQQQPLQHKAGGPMLSFHPPCWDMRLMVSFSQSSGTRSPAVSCGTKTHMIFFFLVKWSRKLSQLSKYFSQILLPNHTPKTLTKNISKEHLLLFSLLFSSESCLSLHVPKDCSTLGFPVLQYFPDFAQTHVHWVGDAIQPSPPLLPPFSSYPQSFPASGSFPRVSSLHWVAKVLELQLNTNPSNEYSRLFPLWMTSLMARESL